MQKKVRLFPNTMYLCDCLSVCLYLCVSISLCVCLSVYMCQLMFHQRGILLDHNLYQLVCVCLSVCLSVYLSVSVCVCQLMFHQRGILLDQNLYQLVCASLSDNYEGVRLAAVKLVCVFSLVYPEQSVALHDFSLLFAVWLVIDLLNEKSAGDVLPLWAPNHSATIYGPRYN